MPTSPQPTIRSRSHPHILVEARAPAAVAAAAPFENSAHVVSRHHQAEQPGARRRAGRNRAGGRDAQRHHPGLRLPQRRLRLLQGQDPRKARSTTAITPRYILPDFEKKLGFALFCRAKPLTDLVIEAREINAAGELRRSGSCPAACSASSVRQTTSRCCILSLPANERLQFLAGQYIEIILRDGKRRAYSHGQCAAGRRAHRAARAQHARRRPSPTMCSTG